MGTQEFYILFGKHPGEEGTPVRDQFEQGSHPHQRVVLSAHVGPGAAPPVTAWGPDQSCTHGVEFNVPRSGQQMTFIKHERREPTLPEMSAASLAKVDHAGITSMHFADCPSQTIR